MPAGSAPGERRGGREKGTPNKATADVVTRLAELGCDPIEGMAVLAMNAENSPELRGRMFAELAAYIAPKRKAIEHSAGPESTVSFVIYGEKETATTEEWMAAHSRA